MNVKIRLKSANRSDGKIVNGIHDQHPAQGLEHWSFGHANSLRASNGAGLPPIPLISLSGTPLPTPIPPSACIPVHASLSDLIVARVYACVVWQGGGMDGQETEIE